MIRDLGTLVARTAVGLAFASHGSQKAFGWFEGPGPAGAAGFLESLGFKPGARFATLTSYTEIAAGALIATGLGGPVGPAALLGVMLVAQTTVHAKNGFFAQKGGIELGVIYVAAAVALASSGYGRFSLDALFGIDEPLESDTLLALALAGGTLGGVAALAQREATDAPS
ncbi:MAG: DoxX family protein [Candidatus Eremiobacteraeota bacterium]|nr:DoxX family protein [Candidatus Eremiobacteraeota bacterium]